MKKLNILILLSCFLSFNTQCMELCKVESAEFPAQKSFKEMTKEEYKIFTKNLFEPAKSKRDKANKLQIWANMAGVPILAFDRHSLFFYANLHVYSANTAPDIEFDKKENDGIEDKFTTKFFNDHIEVEDLRSKYKKSASKKITQDLEKNTLCFLYKSKHGKFFNYDQFNIDADTHYQNYPFEPDALAREFLADFTIPLEKVSYIDEIVKGLILLPKTVVEMMRGKALYFSNARGISRTIITAHCQLTVNYLGLMPGVFMERHKETNQITETFIHEIGHLIDHTVLQSFYTAKTQRSVRFYYQFGELQKLYVERNQIFTGNFQYSENQHNDKAKGKIGFITNYSEKNREEDFAEHFVNFIMYEDKFKKKQEVS